MSFTAGIRDLPSENQDERPASVPLDMLILHATGTKTAGEALERLRDPASRHSAHYLVDEDGGVYRLVPEERRAFHADAAHWRGFTALDDRSVGVAMVNPMPAWSGRPFPLLQVAAVCDLCLGILSRHPIPARNVVGHADVAPERQQDPGELFDWEQLAMNGVGIWPEGAPNLGTGGIVRDARNLRDVRRALGDIGYRVDPEGALDPALSAVLRAFQRHWRPEAVTGQADAGTLARLLGVARLCQALG